MSLVGAGDPKLRADEPDTTPLARPPWWSRGTRLDPTGLAPTFDPKTASYVFWATERAAGWPLPALREVRWTRVHFPMDTGARVQTEGSVGSVSVWGVRLAYQPVFVGLGVNTLASALPVYLGLALWAWTLRRRRVARGRCGWCGYDRDGLGDGVCPECGR